jgi:transposase InsO family protein
VDAAEHVALVAAIVRERQLQAQGRGGDQARRRALEEAVKRRVVQANMWLRSRGDKPEAAARRLYLKPSTVAWWCMLDDRGRLKAAKRGRPPIILDDHARGAVLWLLADVGPGMHLTDLEKAFPRVPREALERLLEAFRQDVRPCCRWLISCLDWRRPGAIYAMDLKKPANPVDGSYPYVLVVRDLGSGKILMDLPLPSKEATYVVDGLRLLFQRYGVPLVLKSDNGSEFKNREVEHFLAERGVLPLLSPAYYPQYNGACEAGVGQLSVRAHYLSARNNRIGQWTSDDLEAARCNVNAFGRPKGRGGPCPNVLWDQAPLIQDDERRRFLEQYRATLNQELAARGSTSTAQLSDDERRELDRSAITKALIQRDYLAITRRRISPPFRSLNWQSISA